MGTSLPPNEPGDPCAECWGVGQVFGDTVTPKFITVTLTDISPGPFWNADFEQNLLTPHLLQQRAGTCIWELDDGVFGWSISWQLGTATVLVQHLALVKFAFFSQFDPNCLLVYNDTGEGLPNRIAQDGALTLTWETKGLD